MNNDQSAIFSNISNAFAKSSIGDIFRTTICDSLVVPSRLRALASAIMSKQHNEESIVVVTSTIAQAESLSADIKAFIDPSDVELLPCWETLPFERISPSIETMGIRSHVISRMGSLKRPKVIVGSARAICQKLSRIFDAIEVEIKITIGKDFSQDFLISKLVEIGYSREQQVEARGEFAIRGSILDIYCSTSIHPIRIEFWGDTVERINTFSLSDQRSVEKLEMIVIAPARELIVNDSLKEKAKKAAIEHPWAQESFLKIEQGLIFEGMESFLPFLTEDKLGFLSLLKPSDPIVFCDSGQIESRLEDLKNEEEALSKTLSVTWDAKLENTPSMFVDFETLSNVSNLKTFWDSVPKSPNVASIAGFGFNTTRSDIGELVTKLNDLKNVGNSVFLVSDSVAGVNRLSNKLSDEGLSIISLDKIDQTLAFQPGIYSCVGDIEEGTICSTFKIAIITDHELAGKRYVRRRTTTNKRAVQTYDDLSVGDYVVHHHHGVGRFEGLETKTMVGVTREYLILSFKGSDKLFVPSDQVGLVRKYIGGEKPTLHKLGGSDFEKTRSSVKNQVNLIAQELVVLYRKRINSSGIQYSPDTPWQKEMEDLFPFELTIDQARAIEEVKVDMETAHPMDRLICGDVGFGKTEVAMRAAFKATQDSRQVAVLVPTTLLATQHGISFEERFSPFGLRVETLSRFKTSKEQDKIVQDVKDGLVDVVIGTHRLLSKDIKFKDVGLLIVDEEQKFGVSHKEAIKHFAHNVDVLTLTATPIPRTLEMSLTGIRDLSMITTPPENRQPILTYVHEYDERAVAEAIRRELLREGQVFFVHNRVKDLEHFADKIRDLIPEARVVTAHGQMRDNQLENVVNDFYDRKYDVLISTTIVESGLDLPAVNTLIVDRADTLGLAQLYQLRGRVGRRGQRAYAYLFSPKNQALSHLAYERLKTIGEFTELGSGFKIAMRDLEIRGAGSLLGDVQSGHIAAVGFDLYCEMVTEAIDELNGIEKEELVDVTIDIPGDALIPQDYVATQDQRFDLYRRLSIAKTENEIDEISIEIKDRFGIMPTVCENLIEITKLRVACQLVGISSVLRSRQFYRFIGAQLSQSQQIRLQRVFKDAIYKEAHILGQSEIVIELKTIRSTLNITNNDIPVTLIAFISAMYDTKQLI